MHARRRGQSHSTRPPFKKPPRWCKYSPEEVESLVVKLARQGYPPSMIGIILRDQYGIPLVKAITGMSITKILKKHGLAPKIPEDLANLIKRAERLQEHLAKHRKDLHNKRRLRLVLSKIHRLSCYYKEKGILPPDWKYEPKIKV